MLTYVWHTYKTLFKESLSVRNKPEKDSLLREKLEPYLVGSMYLHRPDTAMHMIMRLTLRTVPKQRVDLPLWYSSWDEHTLWA